MKESLIPKVLRRRPQDVSRQALSIARALDRLCLVPDDYTLTIHVPAVRRQAWEFELSRVDRLRRVETRGMGECAEGAFFSPLRREGRKVSSIGYRVYESNVLHLLDWFLYNVSRPYPDLAGNVPNDPTEVSDMGKNSFVQVFRTVLLAKSD